MMGDTGKMDLSPPRGTRDFYPDDMRFRNWLFSLWRETSRRYGFEEYDSSILEHEELYVLKSGPEILGQLYNFKDKGERRVALRPEMTPTLVRMVAAKGSALPKPLKWFSIPQVYRYERMSRGRKREHYQWNPDIIGVQEVTAEAEILAVALDVLNQLGLNEKDVVVRISHRGLLGSVLEGLALPEASWSNVFGIIDKRGKEPDEALSKMLRNLGVENGVVKRLFSMLDERSLGAFDAFLDQKGLDRQPVKELQSLFDLLNHYGTEDFCEFSPSIVRGLPYYTGIVFECFDREGEFRALFGGGRYDHLLELLSAGKHPAVGLGFGDVVVQEILEKKGVMPNLSRRMDMFLIPFSDAERPQAVRVIQRLRKQGVYADMLLNSKRMKGALKEAARSSARWVLLLLPDELEEGLFVLRDMMSGGEERISGESFLDDPKAFLCSQDLLA